MKKCKHKEIEISAKINNFSLTFYKIQELNSRRTQIAFLVIVTILTLGLYSDGVATNKIDSLESLIPKYKDQTKLDTTHLIILNELSWEYKNTNTAKAILYGKRALLLANEYLNAASSVGEALVLKRAKATSLNNIGVAYDYQGNYDKALEYYIKALRLNEALNDKQRIATSLNNIGVIYYYQGNFHETLKYYKRALKLREEIEDQPGIAGSLNNIGLLYINQVDRSNDPENLGNAIDYLLKALELKQKLGEPRSIARSLGNIGTVYKFRAELTENPEDYNTALDYYLMSLAVFDSLEDKKGMSIAYSDIADVHHRQGKNHLALRFYKKALTMAKEIGGMNEIRNAYQQLSIIYELTRDFKKSLQYHQLHYQMKDSLLDEESSLKLTEMQAKLENESKENQIEQLSKESVISNLEASEQRVFRNFLIIVLLLVVILTVFIYIRYREKQEINKELEKLSLVASKTDNYVIITDNDDKIEWVNERFATITGYQLDEIKGRAPYEFLRGEDTDLVTGRRIDDSKTGIDPFSDEILNYRKDGSKIWLSLNVSPVIDEHGNVEKYITVGNDITAKKEQEEEIRKLSFIASKTDNFVILTDKDDKIEWVNEGFTRLLGYTLEEIKGKTPGEVLRGPNTDPETIKLIEDRKKRKISFRTDVLNYHKLGQPVWLSLNVTPILNKKGEVEQYINIGAEISEQKRYEEKLKTLAKRLKLVNAIDQVIISASSFSETIDFTIKKLYEVLDISRVSMVIFNFENDTFSPFSVSSNPDSILKEGIVLPMSDFHGVVHLKKLKNYLVQDLTKKKELSGSDKELVKEGIKSYLLVPLVANNELLGSVNICSENKNYFTTELIEMVEEIAKGIAISLFQNQLQEQVKETNISLIEKNKDITYSIEYAKKIQDAIFPRAETLAQNVKESFVLFKPKDIVSGDFYWLKKSGDYLILTLADCTGHGVPAAFISMIGFNLISQAVNENGHDMPADILNYVNSELHKSLNAISGEGKIRDGMDAVCCTINLKKKELRYAGANNPISVVRKGKLFELKPDKFPLGAFFEGKPKKFHEQSFELKDGDTIYLYTDGFYDQFGGPSQKKYMYSQFKELLLKTSKKPMSKQHDILNDELTAWSQSDDGVIEQTDDICVIGIKI